MRLGILGSTRGTNLQALVEAIQNGRLPATIEIVISNKADALILKRAHEFYLPTEFVAPAASTPEDYDKKLSDLLERYMVDFVVLIGYMRILSADFVKHWQYKIINVHPSLLPDFAGKMDLNVHAAVIAAKKTTTGCTVHYVTDEVDAGPILLQATCPVLATDTPETLKERVQALEGETLVNAIQKIINV